MSTTVTFAGNLNGARELLRTRDGNECAAARAVVNRHIQDQPGAWAQNKPTEHQMTIHRTTPKPFGDCAGRRDRVAVHGQLPGEAFRDGEPCPKHASPGVAIEDRFGEVGQSLTYGAGRPQRLTDPAATTENWTR